MQATFAIIIDDSESSIDVLSLMLDITGVDYTAVRHPDNVEAALSAQKQIDVIFLDLEMPAKDGFQLLTQFKQDERLRDVPIVAYTVHTSEMERARQAGFDGFLGKPIRSRDFPTHLERILAGEAVWES